MSRNDRSSLRVRIPPAVFGLVVALELSSWTSGPGLALAQDEELDEPAADAVATPNEDESADADVDESDAQGEVDPTDETEAVDGASQDSAEVASDGIDPIDPEDDESASDSTEADEPDYYGSYEPLAPSLRYEDLPEPKKPPYDGPFRAGRFRLGLSIGGGTYGTETYFVPGFSVGYFLLNGLELHVDTDFWLIGDPFLATPSPGLRYVFWMLPKVHPYVGGFFRHYFVGSGYDDADSVGARAGVYFMIGRRSFFGIGAAYEHMLQDHLFAERDFIYPEIAFVFAF